MKIQTTQKLLFSLMLFGIGFAAVGLSFDAAPTQVHRPTQLGYGHAPHLPLDEAQDRLNSTRFWTRSVLDSRCNSSRQANLSLIKMALN